MAEAQVVLDKNIHVLCVSEAQEPQFAADGALLIFNKIDHSVFTVPLTEEVANFFDLTVLSTDSHEDAAKGELESQSSEKSLDDVQEKVQTVNPDSKTAKNKKASVTWSNEATVSLIAQWKIHESMFKSTAVRNDVAWKKISEVLQQQSHAFTPTQCEDKWKYLKQRCFKIVDNTKQSGAENMTMKFQKEMEEIFAKTPRACPPAISSSRRSSAKLIGAGKNVGCTENVDLDSSSVINSSDEEEPSTKKVKKTKVQKELTSWADNLSAESKSREEAKERRHKEVLDCHNRAIDAYKDVMQKIIDKL